MEVATCKVNVPAVNGFLIFAPASITTVKGPPFFATFTGVTIDNLWPFTVNVFTVVLFTVISDGEMLFGTLVLALNTTMMLSVLALRSVFPFPVVDEIVYVAKGSGAVW